MLVKIFGTYELKIEDYDWLPKPVFWIYES